MVAANVLVFWSLANAAAAGRISLGEAVIYVQSAIGVSMIAFGGFSWALDGAAAPVAAVLRLEAAMRPAGASRRRRSPGRRRARARDSFPRRDVRVRLRRRRAPVLEHFDLTIPAGSSLAIVGQNGAGKTTIAKLLCRLYDPQSGAIEIDGVDLREFRSRVMALARRRCVPGLHPLRVAAARQCGAARRAGRCRARRAGGGGRREPGRLGHRAGARLYAAARTFRAASGSESRSPARWLPCALGAGVVLLDEPTAQLDVRGEAEIFDRLLAATRHCTTILISHRFSTVRHADRICVLEHGRVIELGTHDELMALGGRYRTMFDLQAQRFNVPRGGGSRV